MQTVVTAVPDSPRLTMPDFSIVIVCWNNKRYLEPCLRSLYHAGLHHSFEVVVVDNGSTDGTQAMLRENFPQVCLIQNDRNVGLSAASNRGIKDGRGRYVLLLNDDTLINQVSLDAMVEFMDSHPEAGAVGGKLLNPDGSFQAGYASFSTLVQEFLIATRLGFMISPAYPSYGDGDQVKQVDWLSSACLLLRRSTLDQVGLLFEDYFIYGDETDLQYRFKRTGWKVFYLPEVETIHFGGKSLDRWRRRRLVNRGKMLFYKRNYGLIITTLLRLMMGVVSLTKLAVWSFAFPLPRWHTRAKQELESNLDVLRLCWKLE